LGKILGLIIFFSIILAIVFFFFDAPYWYLSVLFILIPIMIGIISTIWRISGWADDQLQKHLDDKKGEDKK